MPVGIKNYVIHVPHEVTQPDVSLGQSRSVYNLLVLLEVLSYSSPTIFLIFDPLAEIGVVGWIRTVLHL